MCYPLVIIPISPEDECMFLLTIIDPINYEYTSINVPINMCIIDYTSPVNLEKYRCISESECNHEVKTI
jgi:hypothetical protein